MQNDRDKRQFFEEDFEVIDALKDEPDQRVARAIVASADRNFDLGLIEGIKIGERNVRGNDVGAFVAGVVTAVSAMGIYHMWALLWT